MKLLYKQLLLCILILPIAKIHAQKVDLDKFYFDVSHQRLPQEPVEPEKRTYGVKAATSGGIRSSLDDTRLYDKIKVWGWKKVEADPTVGIEISLSDFLPTGTDLRSETVENKDKDGKVTGRTTYYWYEARYSGSGSYRIKGPITPKEPTAKELEEKKKKEEAKTTNKFLVNATTSSQNDAVNDGIAGSLNQNFVLTTEKTSDASSARKRYSDNAESMRSQKLNDFIDGSINFVNNKANSMYGFSPSEYRDFLWILDSKSHPEFQTQQDAIQAVKTLFKDMKADKPIDILETNMQPLIDYFQSLKTKYAGNDKRESKMRYSAFFNLSKIYYFLDKPEKAMAEAEGLIKNEYDEKDGDELKKQAEYLLTALKRAKVTNRHNVLP